MDTTRRDFLKRSAMLSGIGAMTLFDESIQRAVAIEPDGGSTVFDAEHIVVLMQENRSFDHMFGTLRGVRGFDDPRAISLPDGNPVWTQTDAKGDRYTPFRLNLMDSKSTWMGSLPHSWTDQVDARNEGRYDRWLIAKKSGNKAYADMPLTLGYHSREDIPFYYALADAFTVCDQNFCSSLTGTTPNRLHLWTGTCRAKQNPQSKANVLNQDVDYGRWARWSTFPERLEALGVSWKVYQNELTLESGLEQEHDAWLTNFSDNPLEWFEQYGVRYARTHREFILKRLREIPDQVLAKEAELESATDSRRGQLGKEIAQLKQALDRYRSEEHVFTPEYFQALSDREKQLHFQAFADNSQDPNYRELTSLEYVDDAGNTREVRIPKGDVLFQFRKDVEEGKLPTISWLVPPERFSDHPGSAWYGAWYLSETFDILTKNPDLWKKTVFILTYDENDGYFDHIPPFVAPNPAVAESGKVSEGIDAGLEFISLEQDRVWHPFQARGSSIGLGYRVPMIVASPWSRGGAVCSQVFDHTSVLQFMEKFLSRKLGRQVEESNINSWRRTVCGDLTAAFKMADDTVTAIQPLVHNNFVTKIHQAKFKELPSGYRALSDAEVVDIQQSPQSSKLLPKQELGHRPSAPLPYELSVVAALNSTRDRIEVTLQANNLLFKEKASGAPFTAYAFTKGNQFSCRNYAVAAGDSLEDSWSLADFDQGIYRIRVYGPNGYYWSLQGSSFDPLLSVQLAPAELSASPAIAEILLNSSSAAVETVHLVDVSYGNRSQTKKLAAKEVASMKISTESSLRWYDLRVTVDSDPNFERRLAGRLENGTWGQSDPLIGRSS